ncbi:hypothetical protein [Microvirga ossetica]|uniref:hypothetical protein n=1 Tax=Microvirga ossetica TaxID=1882682 RepID=UPI0012FFE8CF|nr:hypothetical protein [Microvirga ossetica]
MDWKDPNGYENIVISFGFGDGRVFKCWGDDFPNSPYNKVVHPANEPIGGKLYEGRITDASIRFPEAF